MVSRVSLADATENQRKLLRTAVLPLLVGLGLLGGSLGYRWWDSSEADRLRVEGVQVPATLTDREGGNARGSGIDRIEVYYMYEGEQHHDWIPCAKLAVCSSPPPQALTIWVDPSDPEHFVAENDRTDGSLFPLMSWSLVPIGAVATIFGVLILLLARADRKKLT
ncbi:DUF3592 domain-containing protein [Micromonospora vinacea]|uniref:DUF3592 domain-containing protein n=1 Tax=Micromonospora vinacea TaxID=709878 RepID=A0ABS0JV27_9ACTN|nr:DUF3592 domain-containing protein [Micromonospora vinacea]MBG6100220.1 hypothetical protein [Micromonospora vinacea]WSZ76826.1 DUF3592 domain-containing protein [Micromonospora sp. NBC_00860]